MKLPNPSFLGINLDIWYFSALSILLLVLYVQVISSLIKSSKKPIPRKRLREEPMDSVRVLLLGLPVFGFFGYFIYKQWFTQNSEPDFWTVDLMLTGYLVYGGLLAFWADVSKRKRAKDPNNWVEVER